MTYYAIQNESGQYWTGGEKMSRPPLLCFSDNVDAAWVERSKPVLERKIKSCGNKGLLTIAELDSREHKRLAD